MDDVRTALIVIVVTIIFLVIVTKIQNSRKMRALENKRIQYNAQKQTVIGTILKKDHEVEYYETVIEDPQNLRTQVTEDKRHIYTAVVHYSFGGKIYNEPTSITEAEFKTLEIGSEVELLVHPAEVEKPELKNRKWY